MIEIKRFPDGDHLAHAAARRFLEVAIVAIESRGRCSVALSGGTTPRALYELLGSGDYSDRVDWSQVHFFWGDERCVPPDDSESIYRMAKEALLDHIQVPADQVHRMKGELDPQRAAREYDALLRDFFSLKGNPTDQQTFDLIYLGMGDDGHTASLFPHTEALQEHDRWVTANYVPKLEDWRLTLTTPTINQAAEVVFLVGGAKKAETLRSVLEGPQAPMELPAQLIVPTLGRLSWFIDKEAAAELRPA